MRPNTSIRVSSDAEERNRAPVEQSKKSKKQIRRVQLGLFLVLFVIVLTTVRYGPLTGLSSAPASFSGPSAFQYYGILKTGNTVAEAPVYSPFSSGTTPQRGEFLFVRYEAILALVTGTDKFAGTVIASSFAESTVLSCIFLLVGWMWGRTYGRHRSDSNNAKEVALTAIVFAAGTPSVILIMIGWNASYGLYSAALTLYLLNRKQASAKVRLLVLILFATLFAFYTTPAFLLTILIIGLAIFKGGHFRRLATLSSIYAAAYITFLSQLLFGTVLRIPSALSAVANFNDRASGLNFIAGSPLPIVLLDATVFGLVATPLVTLLLHRVLGSRATSETRTTYGYVFGLAIFAVGATSSLGLVSGINRTAEYVALLSTILIPAGFRVVKPSVRRLLAIILVGVVILSFIAYALGPTLQAQYLSPGEASGAKWITENQRADAVTFTDFRLAGPLVSQGDLKVIGVSDIGLSPALVNRLLADIYYSNNPCLAETGLLSIRTAITNQSYELLMLSTRMTDLFPGIRGYDYGYQPAPGNFENKFSFLPALAEIYSNGDTTIYARVSPDLSAC